MCDALYFEITGIVGPELLFAAVPDPKPLAEVARREIWTKVQKGVYIVTDKERQVLYVGSVSRRNTDALCSRMAEHVKIPGRSDWWYLYIVPLHSTVDPEKVRVFEGVIGRRLGYDGNLPIRR
jgi:hypothetical protein